MAAEGYAPGQQTVEFSVLVKRAAEDSHLALKDLAEAAPEQSDSERKLGLLKYIFRTRQRLLRLLVLSKWCRQIPLVERCQQLSGTLSNHDTSFTQAADFLYFLHEGLQQARAPVYDIPTAAEVLLTGKYCRLPKCIEDLGMPPTLTGDERETTLQKLDTMLRSRLLDITLPKELSDVSVSHGRIVLQAHGEFEVQLTLGYRGNPSFWRILHLQLLVGEKDNSFVLTEHQRLGLGDDLERRMAASDDPFRILYSILHDFCTTLVMDTLFRQTGTLQKGRWKDAIRFERTFGGLNSSQGGTTGHGNGQGPGPFSDTDSEMRTGLKSRGTLGLKIWYWVDCPKGIAGVDPSAPPHIRIDPGPDQNLFCTHHPPVADPATDNVAEFAIDNSCIDVERMLLRAIACNIHSRLVEVRRGLKGSNRLWRVDCDVALRSSYPEYDQAMGSVAADENDDPETLEESGEECLCVRAYGTSFMSLGISIRTGRFLLRFPSTLLANSVLVDMDDALNQGVMAPVDVFLSLRSKSLLHVFASIAESFNLKIYERGASVLKFPPEVPKPAPGSEVLVMAFKNCGGGYYLALHLDSSFMPHFRLVEGQPRGLIGRSTLLSSPVNAIRSMMISTETIQVTEDDISLNFLDEGRPEAEKQGTALGSVERLIAKDMQEQMSRKVDDLKSSGRGLDSSQTELNYVTDRDHRAVPAGLLSRSTNPLSPSFSSLHSPSGLQGVAATTQHFGGLNSANQGLKPSFSPRSATPPNASLLQSNHRMGRMGVGNGTMTNSARSPLRRVARSPYHGDQDLLQSKSPLHAGESASSPIDLDDDDISKLIDSISSKPLGLLPGGSHPSSVGDTGSLSSRQAQLGVSRSSVPILKSPAINPRTPRAKNSAVQTQTAGRVAGQSMASIARIGSPQKLLGSQSELEMSEWADLDQSSQSVQSPMHLPSPSPRLSTVAKQVNPRSTLSPGISPSDSHKRKRCGPNLLLSLPSVQRLAANSVPVKRRKVEHEGSQCLVGQSARDCGLAKMSPILESFVGQSFATLISAANQGKAPMGAYTAVVLQVVRRCWLCIKHTRLTSQMDELNIPYVEEVGLHRPSFNLRFRLPPRVPSRFPKRHDTVGWQRIRLSLGKPGTDGWAVEVHDVHFRGLWELFKQRSSSTWGSSVQFATVTEEDSHICCTQQGLVLSYSNVQDDSLKKMVADLERLWNARMFSVGMRKLLEERSADRIEVTAENVDGQGLGSGSDAKVRFTDRHEGGEKKWEVMRRAFRVEAVGLTSTWFTYIGLVPGIVARFVVDWEQSHNGCTVHVSPEQLWPHTKYLEDYINGGEVELLLDCIRVTVGPLSSLAFAIRGGRMLGPSPHLASVGMPTMGGTPATRPAAVNSVLSQGVSPNSVPTSSPGVVQGRVPNGSTSAMTAGSIGATMQVPQASGPGRPGSSGLVPSSLLPTDVSVLLRSPYWIRIVYRKQFAMDMRCFAGDQVWLQPAPPPRTGGPGAGGSLPCPQFRPFIMDHVSSVPNAEGAPSSGVTGNQPGNGSTQPNFGPNTGNWVAGSTPGAVRGNPASALGGTRMVSRNAIVHPSGSANAQLGSHPSGRGVSERSHVGIRGEYTALFGLGDDGGYGGAWVPLIALKKVLRGTLRYLGVLWLFAQFPSILRDVLGSILRENEGSLINHDPEQPALRFFIGHCVFAVTMHRQQLYLQAINVKKHPQTQQQPQQGQAGGPESELSTSEMGEINEFFNRRVASEPYDASRLASFVTMLTLPIPVLREFLKLIAWKKEQQKAAASLGQGGDALATRPRIELCLENRTGSGNYGMAQDEGIGQAGGTSSTVKSSIQHYRAQSTVEFTLTLYLDSTNLPVNNAGGASWLPQSVAVRLVYQFSEPSRVSVINVEGSHGGRACWQRVEDWERCKAALMRGVDHQSSGNGGEPPGQGRLRAVAEYVQANLQKNILQLRKGVQNAAAASPMVNSFSSAS